MRILKFGGTSVRDAERIAVVSGIVRQATRREPVAVVVSALAGVTDRLVALAAAAADPESGEAAEATLDELTERHLAAAAEVAEGEAREALVARLQEILRQLRDVARGAVLVGECTPRTRDRILATGELASAELVAARLCRDGVNAQALDARQLVVTDDRHGGALAFLDLTRSRIRRHFQRLGEEASVPIQVITGFLGATRDGATTTLGRGGPDYTAALFGGALDAAAIEIWTDVDGVMSADPRRVPSAVSRRRLSFEELMELAHFGAKVVYPPTVQPARAAGIPLLIRNTLHPEHPGTEVRDGISGSSATQPLAGVTSTGPVSVYRLEGPGMVGIPGFAGRLFQALAQCDVSVILITQASSEHSISFATAPGLTERVLRCVHREFERERLGGALYDLAVDEDVCVVAAVGEGMAERPGIAARLFASLRQARVNVRAIAQGSSERNISTVVARADETIALRAIHDAFFAPTLPRRRSQPAPAPLRVYLAGVGGVGSSVLDLLERLPSPLALCGVADSRRLLLAGDGDHPLLLSRHTLASELDARGAPGGGAALADHLVAHSAELGEDGSACVLVDCSASPELARRHPDLLRAGCSVVTANKLGIAGDAELAEALRPYFDPSEETRSVYRDEATVGAGLPILSTLHELELSGDRIVRIEGVFSGTLAFVLAALRRGRALSEVVHEAHAAGYTEPDPRADLSGEDVARKLLVLARHLGERCRPQDVEVEPLVHGDDLEGSLDEFWAALPAHDDALRQRLEATAQRGRALAYLASWNRSDGRARVSLQEVDPDHPAAGLRGTDNLFVFVTERCPGGLTIQGPGAGTEVTAGAVFSDLLRVAGEVLEVAPGGASS